ncbi:hypothetical protein [Cupriavidus sp. YAF13]|uniref:hypothetical protein n=1 Tax=Cupriavidus sp. YAF13 TaxID=3233075 RepID=UPI003F931751
MGTCIKILTIGAAMALAGCAAVPAYDGYGYGYPAEDTYPYGAYYPAYPYGPYYDYGWWPRFYGGGAVFFHGGGHGGDGRHGHGGHGGHGEGHGEGHGGGHEGGGHNGGGHGGGHGR